MDLISLIYYITIYLIYLKPHNWPIFEKNTSMTDLGPFGAPMRQNEGQRSRSVTVPLNIVVRCYFAEAPYFL